jgi:hypothetical protein
MNAHCNKLNACMAASDSLGLRTDYIATLSCKLKSMAMHGCGTVYSYSYDFAVMILNFE